MAKPSAKDEIGKALRILQPLATRAACHWCDTNSTEAENLMACLDTAIADLKQADEFYAAGFDRENPK